MVSAEAKGLAATDVPVLLRWFPDPNQPGLPAAAACLGATGAPGYIAAFQHIHNLFEAAGATNVAFVWSVRRIRPRRPEHGGLLPGRERRRLDRRGRRRARRESGPAAFANEFGWWYSAFSSAGKPMMVSSTGADSGSQPAYLGQILSDLPSQYPQVKALVYFDAPESPGDQYQLDPAGAASFGQLAAAPAFTPNRSLSTTTIAAPQSSVPVGTMLTLHASVNASDNSGSVSFVDNGEAIKGCAFIPITTPASCQTAAVGAGTQSFVALYGGDAAFSPSTSVPLTVTVAPAGSPQVSERPGDRIDPDLDPFRSGRPRHERRNVARFLGSPRAGHGVGVSRFVRRSHRGLTAREEPVGWHRKPVERLAALPAVQETLGRPLSIVPVFLDWAIPSR